MVPQSSRLPIRSAFEPVGIQLQMDQLQLLKPVTEAVRRSAKFAQIAASIAEVGVIEPPMVTKHPMDPGRFLVLDGHVRIEALRQNGATQVLCLVATDDEAFTYNKRISRLAAIQEHRMILQAVDRKVPEARLARALNIDISTLREKKQILVGICPEAIEILKDKTMSFKVFRILKRMIPIRQIEAAEMMVGMNRYSTGYAQAILAATPKAQLLSPEKAIKGLSSEQLSLMERETGQLDREIKVAEQSYGADHLRLVLARGYINKLASNTRVARYLAQHQPEFLAEFQRIIESDLAAA
jgi:hypothetical protein